MTNDSSDSMAAPTIPDVTTGPTAEFLTLAGLAGLVGVVTASATLGQQAYQLLKSTDPLIIQILDSKMDGSMHQIRIRATNCTVHGIYIESVEILHPKGVSCSLLAIDYITIGHSLPSGSSSQAFSLPRLIPPGKAAEFWVHFFSKEVTPDPWTKVRVAFSKLDEKKDSNVELEIRLRR